MEVKIVLGHTFGDEGKGVTVQWLCKKAIEEGKKPLVVRFSGGPQAAHTIFNGGTEHICSSFGSGVLLGVPTMYTEEVYMDPICLMNEFRTLQCKGVSPKLFRGVHRIITPYDVLAGRNNSKVISDGTCGKGIYPTFERYKHGQWTRVSFSLDKPEYILKCASNYHKIERIPEYDDMFKKACLEILTEVYSDKPSMKDYNVLIFEGTQGLLLDMDCGLYPNVTPSRVGLNGLRSSVLKDAEVYLVTRTYTTRHGNGYEPKIPCPFDLSNKYETNVTNEFQGNFKTGALEVGLLNRAYERHCIDNYVRKYNMSLNLVITHMDVIDGEFKIAEGDAYLKGCRITNYEKCYSMIERHLCYRPDYVYYNDSVESNIKQLR